MLGSSRMPGSDLCFGFLMTKAMAGFTHLASATREIFKPKTRKICVKFLNRAWLGCASKNELNSLLVNNLEYGYKWGTSRDLWDWPSHFLPLLIPSLSSYFSASHSFIILLPFSYSFLHASLSPSLLPSNLFFCLPTHHSSLPLHSISLPFCLITLVLYLFP